MRKLWNRYLSLPVVIKMIVVVVSMLLMYEFQSWLYDFWLPIICSMRGLTPEQAFPEGATNTQVAQLAPIVATSLATFIFALNSFGSQVEHEDGHEEEK